MTPAPAIKEIILGTWGLAGDIRKKDPLIKGYHGISDETAMQVFTKAWDAGIRKVDTSTLYGQGNGIRRLLQWQQESDKLFEVILKAGRIVKNGKIVNAFSREALKKEISRQLEQFPAAGTVLLKDPPIHLLKSKRILDLLGFLEQRFPGLKTGIATHYPEYCGWFLSLDNPFVFQAEFNGVNYFSVAKLYTGLKSRGFVIQGMQPLYYGFLAKPYSQPLRFYKDDWRSLIPAGQKRMMRKLAAAFQQGFCPHIHPDPAVRAAIFCLAFAGLTAVVIGPKSEKQLDSFLAAKTLLADITIRQQANEYIRKTML